MKDLILLLIGSVVMNNCLLQGYLGVTFAMGNAKCPCKCIKLGLSVTAVMVLTTLITWPVQNFVLAPFGLEYLRTLLFVLVILALVYALKAFVKLAAGAKPDDATKQELMAYCRKHIAKSAMPYDIEFRDDMPKTLVGKVAYRVLEEEELKKQQ